MNPPTPSPAPWPKRALRSALIIALVLVWTLLAGLALASALFSQLPGYLLVPTGLLVLFPTALAVWGARRGGWSWPVLAGATLGAAAMLAWLAWDREPLRYVMNIEEVAPSFPGAERSHAVILEYGRAHPTDAAKAFDQRPQQVQFSGVGPRDGEKWAAFVTKNRAAFEQEWAGAAPEREWLGRLNAFDRLGDLTPADFGADIPAFKVWRFLSQRTCAIASLQALDGHGDEAVATLLPMLEVGRKFETSSRTLVRIMIARVVQRLCYETAGFILDRGAPGPAARARLLAAVATGNGPAGARRIVLVEYAHFGPVLLRLGLSSLSALNEQSRVKIPAGLNLVTPLFINPNATANLYGDFAYALADFAEARELGAFNVRQKGFVTTALHGGMKNLGGRLLLNMAVPAYDKVLKSYWEIEDLRVALTTRLRAAA